MVTRHAPRSRAPFATNPRSALGADAAGFVRFPVHPTAIAVGDAHVSAGRLHYGCIYAYDKYLKILNEGTEPLD